MVIETWHWLAFGALVVALLALDLLVFHRKAHEPSLRESFGWSVFWILLALGFNGLVWLWMGHEHGVNFLTGYLVEKSLSMDNLFVFVVIFRFFRVPIKYHYRVLYWGILGAVFLRLGFILGGVGLLQRFHVVLAAFGVLLIYSAFKLAFQGDAQVDPENNFLLRLTRRHFRVARGDYHQYGGRFFVCEDGRWAVTPMFLVLLVVESTDVLFAVDSIPAIFGITTEPFIIFTSNVFAILGLRALYFLLAGVVDLFRYLRFGLAAVLGFIGLKMIAEYVIGLIAEGGGAAAMAPNSPIRLIPPWLSLAVVICLLAISILASIVANRREERQARKAAARP